MEFEVSIEEIKKCTNCERQTKLEHRQGIKNANLNHGNRQQIGIKRQQIDIERKTKVKPPQQIQHSTKPGANNEREVC